MTAFISHSSGDIRFVRLLVRLLEFHGIEYWYSTANLKGGDHFPEAIDAAPPDVDVMLAVVSSESAGSRWVFNEIRTFRRLRPMGRIVPLVIDNSGPAALDELGLSGIQCIGFTECLLHGFENLFSIFGQNFLEPRKIQARAKSDRRISSSRQRLRFGLWKEYHIATGIGQFEVVEPVYSKMMQLSDACSRAIRSFRLTSKTDGQIVDPVEVVNQAVREVWNGLRHSPQKAVFLTEAVAELIWERFNVASIDRRSGKSSVKAAAGGS